VFEDTVGVLIPIS